MLKENSSYYAFQKSYKIRVFIISNLSAMHKDTRWFLPSTFPILGYFCCCFGFISVYFAVTGALLHSRFSDMKAASFARTIFWKRSYFKDKASFSSKKKKKSLPIKTVCVLYFSDIFPPY